MGIDLQYLRYFVEVARCGGVNAAARSLGVSQPTLTRQLQRLEHELGVQLLLRETTGASLTPVGRKILAGAQRTLREADRMLASAAQFAEPGRVRLGLPPSAAQLLLSELLRRLASSGVELVVTEGTNTTLMEGLQAGRLDLAVVACPDYHAAFKVVPLWRESLYLARDANQGALPAVMHLADVASMPLILSSRKDSIRREIDRAFAAYGLAPEVAMELEGVATIKRLLQERQLGALIPWLSIRAEQQRGELTAARVRHLWITRCAVFSAGADAGAAVRTVRDWLQRLPGELLAGVRESGFQWEIDAMPDANLG